MQPPPDAPVPDGPPDVPALRGRLLSALADLIYAPDAALDSGQVPLSLHHPVLRRRTAAVEMLGRFPDGAAVTLLADLIFNQGRARTLPPPLWHWLRDTALLTLLGSTRLPNKEVDRTLHRLYSIVHYPLPWQWPAVYDDLPLLMHYRKQGAFFRAFWLWPLLIGLIPTGILIAQLAWPADLEPNLFRTLFVTVGTGLEIYLVHQVLIALLAGMRGPLLEVPGATSIHWKAGAAGVGALLLIGLTVVAIVSGSFQVRDENGSLGAAGLWVAALLLPLLLLPLFILAHDLERAVRYAPRRHSWGLRLWIGGLRRATDVLYILALPIIAGAVWSEPTPNMLPIAIIAFLIYLFAVPFLVAGGLRVVSRVWPRHRSAGA